MSNNDMCKKNRALFSVFLVSLIAIVAVGFKADKAFSWPLILGFMIIIFMAIGWCIKGRVLGVLINERNTMSLSRFQMVLWTLIILSAYAAIAFLRARHNEAADALNVSIPKEMWMLIGINSAALVGSPMLSSNKTKKKAIDSNLSERDEMGILSVKRDEHEASFTDLFRGDEVKNWNFIDMPRLQMFFFTIIVAIVYCVDIYRIITEGDMSTTVALPSIDQGLLTLMGISNAAYLGGKAVDQTPATQK